MPPASPRCRRWSRLVLGLALAIAWWRPPPVLAQYRVDQWTTDHGLPQNSVLALAQTRDGYLWAATLDGLVRFDGLRFVVFDKATTPGLSTNRFCALCEAAAGTLWIGTEDRGVVRYRAGAFESFGAREGVPDPWVWHVRARDDGAVMLFTPAGAAVFDGGRFRPIGPQERHAPPARWAPARSSRRPASLGSTAGPSPRGPIRLACGRPT